MIRDSNYFPNSKYTAFTFTDCMFLFLKNNGLSNSDLVSFHSMIDGGAYDTDAVQLDISDFKETSDGREGSNIWTETANLRLVEMIRKYVDLAKGKTTLSLYLSDHCLLRSQPQPQTAPSRRDLSSFIGMHTIPNTAGICRKWEKRGPVLRTSIHFRDIHWRIYLWMAPNGRV